MSLFYRLLRIETNFTKTPLLLDPQLQLDPREYCWQGLAYSRKQLIKAARELIFAKFVNELNRICT